jgi:hypothetical protein
MERFLDYTILPIALFYLLFVGEFVVACALLIAKARRDRGMWGNNL